MFILMPGASPVGAIGQALALGSPSGSGILIVVGENGDQAGLATKETAGVLPVHHSTTGEDGPLFVRC